MLLKNPSGKKKQTLFYEANKMTEFNNKVGSFNNKFQNRMHPS